MALARLHSTRDFFRIWFTWKVQAAIIFLLIVAVVMSFSYVCTPSYESTAKLLLLPRTSEGAIISAGLAENRISPVSTQDINTEIELLTSDDVIKDTVRSFSGGGLGLKSQDKAWYDEVVDFIKKAINEVFIFLGLKTRLSPFDANVNLLKNSLEVEPVAMSNIILVSLKAERPKAAQGVLNRLLEIYVKHHNDAFSKEEGVQFFDARATEYRNKLELAEKKLMDYQGKWNIVDLGKQNEANISLLAGFREELKHIEILSDQTQSRVRMLREASAKNEEDMLITKEMRTIPSIVELEKSIVPLLVRRSEILSTYTASSRQYADIEGQIQGLRGEIRAEIARAIRTDELELASLRIKQDSLREKIRKLEQDANRLKEKDSILQQLAREVQIFRNNYMLYASKAEDARIYRERKKHDLANVTIGDKASLPIAPSFPNRILMLIVSILVGFFAALGVPFLLEFLDHRLKTAYEVEHLLSLPVICAMPEIGKQTQRGEV